MEFAKEIITALVSSSIVLGLFLFIAKRYFDGLLSNEFDKRGKLVRAKIDQAFKMSDFVLEKEIGVYPEILEITYRLRNIMRDGIKESLAYKWNPELRPLCTHLTENLYKYRLFLSEEIFNALHNFKQIAQDALVLYDIQTRQENLFDKEGYREKMKEFEARYQQADKLYNLIEMKIREKVRLISEVRS